MAEEKIERYRVTREPDEPIIDPRQFSRTKQEEFERYKWVERKKLELELEYRVRAECKKWLEEIGLPYWKKTVADAKAVVKARKGVMSQEEWELIRKCIHPDNSASPETRNRAFILWNDEKLKLKLIAEKEHPTPEWGIPDTLAEWDAMRQAATEEPKANRAAREAQAKQQAETVVPENKEQEDATQG